MKKRYKRPISQQQFEKAISHTYPMTFEKDGIGGSFADAFNAGYEGRKGGIYRYNDPNSAGSIFYQAGKARKRIDLKAKAKKHRWDKPLKGFIDDSTCLDCGLRREKHGTLGIWYSNDKKEKYGWEKQPCEP